MSQSESSAKQGPQLVDAMVLIGAIAVGLVAHRPLPKSSDWDFWPSAIVLPCATTWTVALFFLHLRHPRPSLARLSRRPGWIACSAGVCGIAIGLSDRLLRLSIAFGKQGFDRARFLAHFRFTDWGTVFRDHLFSLDFVEAHYIATAIAGGWIALALSGRWRVHRDWLDLFGRATAIFWFLSMPSLWILQDWASIQ